MAKLFEDFVEKHSKAGGRAVFIKSLDFYREPLNKFEYGKVLAALDEEIKALKREVKETKKIELDSINKIQEFMGAPEQHFKTIKETNDKLDQAQKQILAAEAEA